MTSPSLTLTPTPRHAVEPMTAILLALRSMFDVPCSMFDVSSSSARPHPNFPRLFSIFVLLLSFCLSSLAATDPSSAFDAANKLYYGGKFTDAIAAYENILYSGQKSVALYYNLGNAYFKSGQIGKAIAFYREAKNLTPRDPDIRANLQFARNQIQGPTLAPGRAQRVLSKLTLNEWTLLAAAALWLCFVILALRQWRPTLKRPLQLYFSAAAIATILLFGCVAISWLENRSTRTAIVISRDVPVRRGPLEESAAAFTVHDGSELRVLDQNNEWLQVTTDPSRIGWLRRDQVLLSPQT